MKIRLDAKETSVYLHITFCVLFEIFCKEEAFDASHLLPLLSKGPWVMELLFIISIPNGRSVAPVILFLEVIENRKKNQN